MSTREMGSVAWAHCTGGATNAAERRYIQARIVERIAALKAAADPGFAHDLRHIDLSDIRIPDSRLAREADDYMQQLSPELLINHCYRTFFWGALLAQADNETIHDMEEFYIACILHDLGCVAPHRQGRDDMHCFACEGALAAETFLSNHGMEADRVEATALAIIQHTNSWGVDPACGPTAVYLHAGAACDVVGERAVQIPPAIAEQILSDYPGLGFGKEFGAFIADEVAARPQSRMAIAIAELAAQKAPPMQIFPWEE